VTPETSEAVNDILRESVLSDVIGDNVFEAFCAENAQNSLPHPSPKQIPGQRNGEDAEL